MDHSFQIVAHIALAIWWPYRMFLRMERDGIKNGKMWYISAMAVVFACGAVVGARVI